MLAEKHAQIFEEIKPILYSKVSKLRRPNPDIEVNEFKSITYEILTKLDSRLHTLIIEKETSGLSKDQFYDPAIHSESMLLDTVYKYLVRSFANHQIKKMSRSRGFFEIALSGTDVEDIGGLLSPWVEPDTDKFISGTRLLKKINGDLMPPEAFSAQSATQYHFLKALAKAAELAIKEYEISFVAVIEDGQPRFAKAFYFVLWKEMPRTIATEMALAESPLVKKSLQKLIDSEQALKKRVSRYFNEYKGGVGTRIMKS